MATCRDIVTRALHMTGVVPREEDPSAAELEQGLTVLQSLYDGWLQGGMFGRLTDVYEPGDYEAEEGQRVFIDSGTATLPATVDDESRKPRDLVAIEVTDDAGRRAYIWDRNAWVRLDSLAAGDDAPLAERGVNGLAACLALAYADEFGADVRPGVVRQCAAFKTALSFKFGSERAPSTATYF